MVPVPEALQGTTPEPEPEAVTFKVFGVEYRMKPMLGHMDLMLISQFTNPQTGMTNWERVWFKRLNMTVISPGVTDYDYKHMEKKVLETLKLVWTELNAPDTAGFLEAIGKDEKEIQIT